MTKPVCLITGVGPGTGSAIVRRFANHYQVAMLARKSTVMDPLAAELPDCKAYPCDVTDTPALDAVLDAVRDTLGNPEVVIHNAVGGAFGDFLNMDPERLRQNFEVNTMSLLHLGQQLVPAMIEAGRGSIICTGNTSAYRGKAGFAGFAPTKAAQRILAESMARHAGPLGVHVAYVAIDAVINLPWTRKRNPDAPDDFFCHPVDIAEHVWQVAHQPRSAWTFDSIIRPFGEPW